MNLPSSLALPQSKLFQGRTGILLLVLLLVLAGAGAFLFLRHPLAPMKSPSVATSPDAIATPRPHPHPQPVSVPKPVTPPPVVYGPPAPDWVVRTVPVSASEVPGSGVAGVNGAPATAATATAVPAPAPAVLAPPQTAAGTASIAAQLATPVPGAARAGIGVETPQALDSGVLFAREQYIYSSGDRRDPFQSLLDGRFQTADDALVDVGDIHLVGIMWGVADKFALVEDSRGRGYVLRVGDPVVNGYISGISRTELQVVQNAFGDSQSISIQLKPKEGDTNATRN